MDCSSMAEDIGAFNLFQQVDFSEDRFFTCDLSALTRILCTLVRVLKYSSKQNELPIKP